ncbi:chromosome partitioning protein [Pontibacter ummariensis]|uniref:Chromosome partitioning protein n=1 Tax=Pontibacter ummariensis TaxID=1610492 RepID=A0A239C985_9BACT|nr:ParA family protein [Pontibacter ummariensis]PRY15390.1 chromosome partitioning protein [Pontibacter ummariensis]SNS16452.1 chromosome partitioning protein [Pontibacter ummariensis]
MMKPKVVAVINQKGGTGKTTTTINLGSALSKRGKKVLLVDLDPQSNLSYSLAVTSPAATLADVFLGNKALLDILLEKDGLWIAPGSNELVDIEISLVTQPEREMFLKRILAEATDFDYVLIDCPPSLSVLTLNALTAAEEVLIPLQMEVLTLQGLDQILNTVEKVQNAFNPQLKVRGIVVVMFDVRRKLSQEVLDYLRTNVKENIFNSQIRLNVKLAEAPSFGQSIIDYDPSSKGAADYGALAEEYLSV